MSGKIERPNIVKMFLISLAGFSKDNYVANKTIFKEWLNILNFLKGQLNQVNKYKES